MKIKKDKIKESLLKALWLTAKHAFFACLVLFLVAFFFGVLLFNKCNIISHADNFSDIPETFLLKDKIYSEVLENWQRDEKNYESADSKNYPNPFSRQGLTEQEI